MAFLIKKEQASRRASLDRKKQRGATCSCAFLTVIMRNPSLQ